MITNHTTKNATTVSSSSHGTLRWMAPELLDPDAPKYILTTSTDVYALAMLFLEVLTGKPPFSELTSDIHVTVAMLKGRRPRRPTGLPELTDDFWKLAEHCWEQEADRRPHIGAILNRLREIAPNIPLDERLKCFDSQPASSIAIVETVLDNYEISDLTAGDSLLLAAVLDQVSLGIMVEIAGLLVEDDEIDIGKPTIAL
jgi:serine/threonine protein kinase